MTPGELTLASVEVAGRKSRSELPTIADGPARDRRLEDWIAANLDPDVARSPSNLWSRLVGALPTARRPRAAAGRERGFASRGGWERFAVVHKRATTVVRVTRRALVRRADIDEWANDLRDLIAVGNHRIILDFARVERLGSWIVAAVVEAHRMCEAHPGGRLKVCGLAPALREIFRIIGVGRRIHMAEDEARAIDGPWPVVAPRALPVDVIAALADASALPPLGGGAPIEPIDDGALEVGVEVEGEPPPASEPSAHDPEAEDPAARIKHEVIEGVLIVTPVLPDLDDEAASEALRQRLLDLAGRPLPRRVAIDLEFVGRLSRRTVGVLLAHHLRLVRDGGGLRICAPHPRIAALLEQVRFTVLVDCLPTLDEAVLSVWDGPSRAE